MIRASPSSPGRGRGGRGTRGDLRHRQGPLRRGRERCAGLAHRTPTTRSTPPTARTARERSPSPTSRPAATFSSPILPALPCAARRSRWSSRPCPWRSCSSPRGMSEEVTVTAHPGRVESVDAVSQPVNVVEPEEIGLRAKAVMAAGRQRRGGRPPPAHEPDDGGHLRARPDRQQGQRLRRRPALLDRRRSAAASTRSSTSIDPASLEAVEVLRGPEQRPVRQRRHRRQRPVPHAHAAPVRGGREIRGTYSTSLRQRRRRASASHLDHHVCRARASRCWARSPAGASNTLRAGGGDGLPQRAPALLRRRSRSSCSTAAACPTPPSPSTAGCSR